MGKKVETVSDFIFLGSKVTVDCDCSHEIKRHLAPWKKSYDKPRQCIKKQRSHCWQRSSLYSENYGFSNSHVQLWELDCKEVWAPKNWCFWTVVLEKSLESPLESMQVKPANPKRIQPWIFVGRSDAEAPVLWAPAAKNWTIRKDPDAGKDWGQEKKGATEDEMVGGHHWFNGWFSDSMDHLGDLWEIVKDREAWHAHAIHGVAELDTT